MISINNNNISNTLYTFNNFHDGSFSTINYDIIQNEIEIIIDGYRWNKESYNYNTQPIKCKITMLFKNIEKVNIQETFYWDFIDKAIIKEEEATGRSSFTFIDDEDNQTIIISCREILINSIDIK